MIKVVNRGDFKKTNSFLEKCLEIFDAGYLDKYGKMGVEALSQATPKRTGKTAASWRYSIIRDNGSVSIVWDNTNTVITNGQKVSVAILIQYGHGTRNGGYVKGRDYINPAIRPIFDQMAEDMWKGVVNKK